MDKWTELRTAYWVAKLGTVSGAAHELGLHRATVNRHIDALEEGIGGKVFIRHARGYALTETGQDVLRVAQKADELISDLAGRVQGANSQVEGEIKLTILAPFAGLLMEPLRQFRAENPHCLVHLDVSDDLARLEYGEAHVALRVGAKPEHPDYVATRFGNVAFNLYAHDTYLVRCGMPKDEEDLAAHSFVLPQMPPERLPWGDWLTTHVPADRIALVSNDIWVVTEALCAGVGLGFMSGYEAKDRGHLHPVLPPNPDWRVGGWIVSHVDLHQTDKVQAMLRCIKASWPGTNE